MSTHLLADIDEDNVITLPGGPDDDVYVAYLIGALGLDDDAAGEYHNNMYNRNTLGIMNITLSNACRQFHKWRIPDIKMAAPTSNENS